MVVPDPIRQHKIFDSVPEDVFEEIWSTAQIAPFAPGEVIVPAGQPFTFFGVVLEG